MPERTVEYRKLLQNFLKEKNIKSVLDFGCGDWMFSYLMDWDGINYLGIDCVKSVIDKNLDRFESKNIFFECRSNIDFISEHSIIDLLIIKDVLQHWDSETITKFLDKQVKHYKYILITNNSLQTEDSFITEMPTTQNLSANFLPLKKYSPEILLSLMEPEPKETCLITTDI